MGNSQVSKKDYLEAKIAPSIDFWI